MDSSDIIRKLCRANGLSVTKLEVILGFSNGSLTKNRIIRSDRLYKVAQHFGVTMEYLMTGQMETATAGSIFTEMQEDNEFMDNILTLWNFPEANKQNIYKCIRHENRDIQKALETEARKNESNFA